MDILPIVLFVVGAAFLFLGWRWQSTPNEEALTALKGLAYLKREISHVQNQVHELEEKMKIERVQEAKIQEAKNHEARIQEAKPQEVKHPEEQLQEMKMRERLAKVEELVNKALNLQISDDEKSAPSGYSALSNPLVRGVTKNKSVEKSGVQPGLPSKYQDVLALAQQGYPVPEIAQSLRISQDAVMMVLRTHQKGGNG